MFELPSDAAARFPAHGWLRDTEGVRHLRLPILRLYQMEEPSYARYRELELTGQWLQFRSPFRTLRHLAVCLRDLHKNIRLQVPSMEIDWFSQPASKERDRALTVQREAFEGMEVSLIAAFVLLRRLADELVDATRPILFSDWHSAPAKLDTAIKMSADGRLDALKPICDFDLLKVALASNTGWLNQLRKDEGVRDVLVHKGHMLNVGQVGSGPADGKIQWRVSGSLMYLKQRTAQSIDLFPVLTTCIAGACTFMEQLYKCAVPITSYSPSDVMFLTGSDNDIVGFWPPIAEARTEFPLQD